MAKLLDENGLAYFWGKVKAAIPTKTSQLTNDSSYITADSPALTGVPTAPTAAVGDSSTQIATTAFVKTAIASNVLNSIEIVTPPTKTEYNNGDALSLDGMVVKATYDMGITEIITDYTTDPVSGAVFSTTGTQTVTVSYTKGDITKTASFTVNVTLKIVTWAGGTDGEIVNMVAAADAGEINLADYWVVGDTRTVDLPAMEAINANESHAAQTVTLVLLNAGGKTLTSGEECSFVVGLLDCLNETGHMNVSNSGSGTASWEGSRRRAWCNNVFKTAMLSTGIGSIFKEHYNITATQYNKAATTKSTDWFALAAAKEIFGGSTVSAGINTGYSNSTEFKTLSQFSYYADASHCIKKVNGSACIWWERSPHYSDSYLICAVDTDGSATYDGGSYGHGLAPFGCI